jgi:hypothetical protein
MGDCSELWCRLKKVEKYNRDEFSYLLNPIPYEMLKAKIAGISPGYLQTNKTY